MNNETQNSVVIDGVTYIPMTRQVISQEDSIRCHLSIQNLGAIKQGEFRSGGVMGVEHVTLLVPVDKLSTFIRLWASPGIGQDPHPMIMEYREAHSGKREKPLLGTALLALLGGSLSALLIYQHFSFRNIDTIIDNVLTFMFLVMVTAMALGHAMSYPRRLREWKQYMGELGEKKPTQEEPIAE